MELSIVWVVYIHTCGYPHPQAPPIPLRRKLIYGMCLVGSEHTPSVSVETIFIFWLAASWIITWRSSISCVNVTVMLWWRWSHLALLLEIKHWWNHTCAKPYQARIARLTLAKHILVRLAILSSLVCTHDMPKHILYCGWLHITSRTAQFSFVIHTRNWDNQ